MFGNGCWIGSQGQVLTIHGDAASRQVHRSTQEEIFAKKPLRVKVLAHSPIDLIAAVSLQALQSRDEIVVVCVLADNQPNMRPAGK